jgi:hypothetical protein
MLHKDSSRSRHLQVKLKTLAPKAYMEVNLAGIFLYQRVIKNKKGFYGLS